MNGLNGYERIFLYLLIFKKIRSYPLHPNKSALLSSNDMLLSLLIFLPLLGALIIALLPKSQQGQFRWIALGITVDKGLQHHDWSRRPITPEQLVYLANDVRHLFTLDAKLGNEARGKGLEDYVADETAYKLAEALRPPEPTRAPHLRVKGASDLARGRLPLLRRVHAARESLASALDLPPFKVLPPDVLVVLAREAPLDPTRLTRLLGPKLSATEGRALFEAAIREGRDDTVLDDDERESLDRKPPPLADRKAYKRREDRLRAFRRREAELTGTDEQAILPGHCTSELVARLPTTLDELTQIPGLGTARIARYGTTLLDLLILPPEEPAT